MKVFQIVNNICYWDATRQFPTVEDTFGKFPLDVEFVSAPDYVFEGWGYDRGATDPWIKPTPPEGWLYDDATGTFYLENPPEWMKSDSERITEMQETIALLQIGLADADAMNVDQEYRLTLMELGIDETETE